MKKKIEYNEDARVKLKKGVDQIANAVKVTLGPNGRNVIIGDYYSNSHITKDGVTVAKHVFVDGDIENIGAQAVKQISIKTAKNAGDGTTSSLVLAQDMISSGLDEISKGANPMDVKRGMDKASIAVVERLKEISNPIKDNSEIKSVATISANNDESIGEVIAEAMEIVDNKGTISVAESDNEKTYIKKMDGYEFPQGFVTPYFINNEKRGTSVLTNPLIIISDNNITNLRVFQEIITDIFKLEVKRDILFIVDAMEGEALGTLIQNHKSNQKGLNICVVKAPYIGSKRLESLIDIGAVTGGRVYSERTSHRIENASIGELGTCSKVIIDDKKTTIINGGGDEKLVNDRAEVIEEALKNADEAQIKNFLQERLDRIRMSQAVIHIGATTSMEMEEKKDRYDDAICATKSAVEEGIVPGGGVALMRCMDVIDSVDFKNRDEEIGGEIIKKSLLSPLRTIISNAGWKEGSEEEFNNTVEKIKTASDFGYGLNAKTGEFENLIETGVIDPTKVTRNVIENSSSIASLLLTTECVIADVHEQDQ